MRGSLPELGSSDIGSSATMSRGGPMTAFAASRTSRACASIVLAGSLLAGCGSGSSPSTPTQPVATVTVLRVTQPPTSMAAGETLQPVATATLSDGRTVTTRFEVRWTSADEKIATVNGSGLVTAYRDGSVVIT